MRWVVMKTAMTLDGKIAAYTGDSKWVTGEESRQRVQEMRAMYMGIMVGSGTARIDDPMLNCRLEREVRQPLRIVVDSRAGLALDSHLVKTARQYRTVVAHTDQALAESRNALAEKGVELLLCRKQEQRVDLKDLLKQLGNAGIDSILLEGGGGLNEAFLKNGLVDEVYAFIAPKIIGGKDAKTPVEGRGFPRMSEAVILQQVAVEIIGEDVLIHGKTGKGG